MKCLLCEVSRGISEVDGVPLCSSCREDTLSTCSCCEGEMPKHNFYMNDTRILRYILKMKKYKQVCRDCAVTLKEEVKASGLRGCPQCGELHTHTSEKIKDICTSCEEKLIVCVECGDYAQVGSTYNLEGGKRVCHTCYYSDKGSYLRCTHCGRFHKIGSTRLYQESKFLCSHCTVTGFTLCTICGSLLKKGPKVSEVNGEVICSSCKQYKCTDCGVIPIRPRMLNEGDGDPSVYCTTCSAKRGSAVKQEWNYCPAKFYFHEVVGDKDELYLGFENEQILPRATSRGSRTDLAKVLANFGERDVYSVFDGSIGGQEDAHGANGYELVSHPRTLKSHTLVGWSALFTSKQKVHSTCGMHVHMSRSGFDRAHLLRLMNVVYMNDKFIELIAERCPNEYTQSIDVATIKSEADAWYKPKSASNRRVKVNLCNKHTVELRFYSNVINEQGLMKNLEFTHALYYYTKGATTATLKAFLSYIDSNAGLYSNLIKFLKTNKGGLSLCV